MRSYPHCASSFLLVALGLAGQAPGGVAAADDHLLARQEWGQRRAQAAAALEAAMREAIAAATAAAVVDRHQRDRAAWQDAGLLPASLPDAVAAYERQLADADGRCASALAAMLRRMPAARDATTAPAAEIERFQAELRAAMGVRDLRARVGNTAPAGWQWDGPRLQKPVGESEPLRLAAAALFPTAYELALEVVRTSGDGELRIAFPLAAGARPGQRRGVGVLVLDGFGGGLSGFRTVDGKRVVDSSAVQPLSFATGEPLQLAIRCDGRGVRAAVGDAVFASVADPALLAVPGASSSERSVDGAEVVAAAGSAFELRRATLRQLGVEGAAESARQAKPVAPAEAAAPAKAAAPAGPAEAAKPAKAADAAVEPEPAVPIPADATWTGSWEESGVRDGPCQSIQVVAADATSATLAITTSNGAKFRVTLTLAGRRVTAVAATHTRTANGKGAKMELSNFKVLASRVVPGEFSVTFHCDREQGQTREKYEVTIKARRPK